MLAQQTLSPRPLCLALLAVFPLLANADVAGRFQFVSGDVRVVAPDGREQAARKGQELNEGDVVVTAANASAQLRMIDGGMLALRPETRLKMTAYVFKGVEDGSENAVISLLRGGFRAITGLIGKTHKQNYKIDTPTATIGIRGTDHEPVVVLPPPPGVEATTPPGTYDRVNVGRVALSTETGTALIGRNQIGYAAAPNQAPVILPRTQVPDIYQATPAPRAGKPEAGQQSAADSSSAQETTPQSGGTASASASTSADSVRTTTGDTQLAATSSAAAPAATDAVATTPAATLTATSTTTGGTTTLNLSTQSATSSSSTGGSQTVALTEAAVTDAVAVAVSTDTPGLVALLTYANDLSYNNSVSANGAAATRDAAGQLTAIASTWTDRGYPVGSNSLSQTGSTLTDFGRHAGTGLFWGRWQGGQLTAAFQYLGQDASGNVGLGADNADSQFVIGGTQTNAIPLGLSSLHWIYGTAASPGYLAQVLTGAATYTAIGGTRPTDSQGNLGTLNLANTTLAANFTAQTVSAGVDFSLGGNRWVLQGSGLPLFGNHFYGYAASCSSCASTLTTFTKNGETVQATNAYAPYANLSGILLGAGLNAGALQYSVSDAGNTLQGVVGFSGATQNVNAPYRAVGIEDGSGGISGYYASTSISVPSSILQLNGIEGGEAPVGRVVFDASGGLTEFVGKVGGYTPLSEGATTLAERATIKIGSAANRDAGSAVIDGMTVNWGRWENGAVDIYSLDGSTKLGTIANANRSIHWLASASTLTGPMTTLPLTGSASYTLVGNTRPTDFNGNVGTLDSATLSANFSTLKMSATVAAHFDAPTNRSHWTMSAGNVPIGAQGNFDSSSLTNASHTASCTGAACGAQTVGALSGTFLGNAAAGAALTYRMATGTGTTAAAIAPTNGVVGLAVFRR